jgi:hypothetical protein
MVHICGVTPSAVAMTQPTGKALIIGPHEVAQEAGKPQIIARLMRHSDPVVHVTPTIPGSQ